jgi:hypothetical protein
MVALLKALSVFGLAATKFLMGVGLGLGLAYSFWPAFLLTFFGGITGFVVFTLFSQTLQRWYRKWRSYRQLPIFTRFSRTLIRIRQYYGLLGISILTPVFLTVPVGAFMATSLGHNRKVISLYMGSAFLGWSLLLVGSFSLWGLKPQDWLQKGIALLG